MSKAPASTKDTSEIIALALSDHVSFESIFQTYGLRSDEVKALMRTHLRPGSYRAWRRRVRTFSDRRERYKRDRSRVHSEYDE